MSRAALDRPQKHSLIYSLLLCQLCFTEKVFACKRYTCFLNSSSNVWNTAICMVTKSRLGIFEMVISKAILRSIHSILFKQMVHYDTLRQAKPSAHKIRLWWLSLPYGFITAEFFNYQEQTFSDLWSIKW